VGGQDKRDMCKRARLLIGAIDRLAWFARVEKVRPRFADQDLHDVADNCECGESYEVLAIPGPDLPIPGGAIAATVAVLVAVSSVAGVLHDPHLKPEDIYVQRYCVL